MMAASFISILATPHNASNARTNTVWPEERGRRGREGDACLVTTPGVIAFLSMGEIFPVVNPRPPNLVSEETLRELHATG